MSIEQKIAEMLAESRSKQQVEDLNDESNVIEEGASAPEANHLTGGANHPENPDSARNNVDNEDEVAKGTTKKPNVATQNAEAGDQSVIRQGDTVEAEGGSRTDLEAGTFKNYKEDVDALVNGEDLSEEFKAKAATIFEAAIVTRVKEEVARLEEEFEAKLEEAVAKNQEGLVEKVDGYLNYVVETWIAQNEIALERGMKSEIVENFIGKLKGLFVESYIDVPEEKYDLIGQMEEEIEALQAKLDEQVAINVEMNQVIDNVNRETIVSEACEGLTDTEVEKFASLVEELAFEDAESFAAKVQTIRENYFTNKASAKPIVESVVTDSPVETLTEEKVIDPSMKRYMSVLNNIK